MALLDYKAVKEQSIAVFNNFEKKWTEHSLRNVKVKKANPDIFWNIGLGKNLVVCAMGASLEKDIEAIKQYRDKVDVMCCDKAFGKLLDNEIKADYVMLADANISYDKWLKPYIDQTKGVKLISTIYANPEWCENWQGEVSFYMNKDAISTEKYFLPTWGDSVRLIPASSNVSNAMLVFMTGCDDNLRINYSGYQNYFLTGFDYSWKTDGNYYAFDNPIDKRHYMNHKTFLDVNKDVCHTSENLIFSAKWMMQFVTSFGLPIVNCSGRGLLEIPKSGDLSQLLPKLTADKTVANRIRKQFENLRELQSAFKQAEEKFNHNREVLIWQ